MANNSLEGTIPIQLFSSLRPLQLILSRNLFTGQLLGGLSDDHGQSTFTSSVYGLLLDRVLYFSLFHHD